MISRTHGSSTKAAKLCAKARVERSCHVAGIGSRREGVPSARQRACHPDGRAAAKVIESVRPLVSELPLDPEPLRRRAETLEVEQRKTLKSHRANVQKLTESPTGEMFR